MSAILRFVCAAEGTSRRYSKIGSTSSRRMRNAPLTQKAIGGSLTIDRVCEKCTRPLGTHVDAPLVDHPFVVEPRSRLGIPGRGGRVPDPVAELLSGRWPFTDDPDQYAIHCPDPETGKLRPKLVPSKKLVTLPDGRKAMRVVIDELDLAEIPKIVQRVRRRAGLPALSTDELAVEVQRILASEREMVGNRQILITPPRQKRRPKRLISARSLYRTAAGQVQLATTSVIHRRRKIGCWHPSETAASGRKTPSPLFL